MRNIGSIVKQAQQMQERMAKMQEELATIMITGQAGGGMVEITINGQQVLQKIKIDPKVVDPADVEMLEDLVAAAYNDCLKKHQELNREHMNRVTGGVSLPGMNWPM